MRRTASLLLALLLALGWTPAGTIAADPPPAGATADEPTPAGAVRTASGRVLPELPAELTPSVHAEMLADHVADAPAFEPGGAPTILLTDRGEPRMAGAAVEPMETVTAQLTTAGLPNGLRKQVFGFLPYWLLTDAALADMNYHLVSTIAYFSVGANRYGHLVKGSSSDPSTGWAGWTSSRMTEVINRAHANGVKVVLTVTMMAWDSASANRQAALLGSTAARKRLVNEIVDAVGSRGADGVNLDFEPLATSLRDEYVSFVRQLKAALLEGDVGANLTVCVMAGAATWATGYDVAGLTASGAANALFVMGYDYHWSGSSRAGGVAPIQSPYTLDVAGTMADFLTETTGSKLIWGVPYYGRTWPTSGSGLNAPTLGHGSKSYVYTGHLAQAAQHGRRWDDVGKVPWYRHWDNAAGNWVQGYYDDVHSLGVKYDLINARGLAGTGMWTLLMDRGRDELWHLLADKFVNDTAPPVGGVSLLPATTDAQAVRVGWRAEDYASGVRDYNVQYRLSGGTWQSWLRGTKKTGAWFTGTVGSTYQFRVRAFDRKGNAQAWVTVPGKPARVRPEAFAIVKSATLNVRSGPGTSYGIVASATKGDRVYVLEGPVTSGGMAWFRVQYGFSEWPSADFPLIAWMASSDADTVYLGPSVPPTTTKLSPFVRVTARTAAFSPNGDGVLDGATVGYTLKEAATDVRLDVLDSAGSVVRSIGLGAKEAGPNTAAWNGRTGSGTWAPAGEYLLRITAVDQSGAAHSGPAPGVSPAALGRWGTVADLLRPTAAGTPRAGAEMVPAKAAALVTFSEPISGLTPSTVRLRVDGVALSAAVDPAADGRSARLTPSQPLPVNATVRLWLSRQLRDAAGNPVVGNGWTFQVAPGSVYAPARKGDLSAGARFGYLIAQDGDLYGVKKVRLSRTRSFAVGQRAVVPNLPGRWLLAESGALAGRWLRESPAAHVDGQVERVNYAGGIGLRLLSATHVGYRFTDAGDVWQRRSMTASQRTTATAVARAIINGRAYWRIFGGPLDGYWLAESALAFKPGFVDRMSFSSPPQVDVTAGSHTGFVFSTRGVVNDTVTTTYGRARGLSVSAWAVINGRAHFLVASGALAGTWLPESSATALHV
jgi:spore germination protein YaaH